MSPSGDDLLPVKVASLIHARRRTALGFFAATSSPLKPAMPATRTEVSTTPLPRRFGGFGANGQARLSTFAAVRVNRVRDLPFRHSVEVAGCLSGSAGEGGLPTGSLPAARQVFRRGSERPPLAQFLCQGTEWDPDLDRRLRFSFACPRGPSARGGPCANG